jgi:hypothetical protein
LMDLLETYDNQEKILLFGNPCTTDSYLNSSKFLINEVGWNL